MKIRTMRWMALLFFSTLLSGCVGLGDWLSGDAPSSSAFDLSNPKNLAHLCARSDQAVDWQACFTRVYQLCGKDQHPIRVGLYAPMQTRHPFYNGYYMSFQCEEGASDGQVLHRKDPVTGADLLLQPPPPPETPPQLDFGVDPSEDTPPASGDTPPAGNPPPAGQTPPSNPPPSDQTPPVSQITRL